MVVGGVYNFFQYLDFFYLNQFAWGNLRIYNYALLCTPPHHLFKRSDGHFPLKDIWWSMIQSTIKTTWKMQTAEFYLDSESHFSFQANYHYVVFW